MYKTIRFMLKTALALLMILLIVTAAVYIGYRLFPVRYLPQLEKYCEKYDVDIYLAASLIKAESNFKPDSISRAGACGLMQLTNETFEFCVRNADIEAEKGDIFDAEKNISAGIWYLSYLMNKYNSDITCAAAAYNAGFANVDKWLVDESCSPDGKRLVNIPFGETSRHVKKIKMYMRIYKVLYPGLGE